MAAHTKCNKARCAYERGATFVEFSITALFLVVLITVSVQLLYMAYMALAVQYLSFRGLRVAVIGSGAQDGIALAAALKTEVQALGHDFGVALGSN